MSSQMSDEPVTGSTDKDGDHIANKNETKIDTESKDPLAKEPKSVSFNRDVHIKRFGKPRETRSLSTEHKRPTRKEPFTHLSEEQLIEEANKVLAQADSVTCTADHPPEKFFSLPHRRKFKDPVDRRNSDDSTVPDKKPLGRSTSDVSQRKKERTSLSTLFRKAQRTKSPEAPVAVSTKPAIVKRSKSDVSDLKSNTSLNSQPKPIRKRSGSETEEFLKSLRNKKTQLSPIIESSPREDYFKKTPPLDTFLNKKLLKQDSIKSVSPIRDNIVNPVEKPPRYNKTPEKEPKPPTRSKRSKSSDKELSPSITETPKRQTEIRKTLLVDEIDNIRGKDINPVVIKDRIKDTIKDLEDNVHASQTMIHSSQQPPDKPPLTRGHTVDPIVRILKEDQLAPPKKRMITPQNNQAFSYIKSNDLFGNGSPDRELPLNNIDKGVVYAQVVRDKENGSNNSGKQTIHKTYSPSRERFANISDDDEGYEEKLKYSPYTKNIESKLHENGNGGSPKGFITEPISKPKYREYKLTSYEDHEPAYANEYPVKENHSREYVDTTVRGRADGTDDKRKPFVEVDVKDDLDFNELSHRRKLLESRLNARRTERAMNTGETITRYLTEKDPIYEANKRMKATEKYVNETARYYSRTLERDGFAENSVSEDYSKYDSDNHKIKYNTETRHFERIPKGDLDRREFIDTIGTSQYKDELKMFPPEPEYEPPSLELEKPVLSPDEYTEKKYKVKSKHVSSSHDAIQTGHKYKKDDWFNKKKGHYASNPDINHDSEDYYANLPYDPSSYHNSLKRGKNRDKYLEENYGIRRHDSGDSRDYYAGTRSPRRLDVDNRLVDSGIENDFRKESGEIHSSRFLRPESDDDIRDTSLFLASERQHTEDNYPCEQIYANGEYLARFESRLNSRGNKDYSSRERSADDGSHFSARNYRYDKSESRQPDRVSAKPPKANTKKLYGLDMMKQLFSRDSSKKSKDKEVQSRTRVLKSPELDDAGYRRYKDPEPSDEERRGYRSGEDARYRSSDPRDSDEKYREDYQYRERARRHQSSERDSDRQDGDFRKTRSKTAEPLDSPALAERYRERRRLATPSPPPSPPVRHSSTNWFKSLDRLTGKRNKSKTTKPSSRRAEDEMSTKTWTSGKPLNSPAKNLRFFGDTDQDSDGNAKHSTVMKSKSHPSERSHTLLRKTTSNSSAGHDEPDRSVISNKSSSLSNLQEKTRRPHKRLHNISEVQSYSETESNFGRKVDLKPPIPYDRRSRSHSNSKTLKGRREGDRRASKERVDDRRGSRERVDDRGSSSELRGKEYSDVSRHRRRTPANLSGESSTEGDSSHQSQRSVVYLHATTVGDIPDPGRLGRNRSRDDVSSVNSSNLQVRTTQKSFSIFAPWTPKHYPDQRDVHYDQRPRKTRSKEKEPIKKYSSTKNLADRNSTLQKNKSYSQTTLNRRPPSSRLTSSNTTLYRKPERKEDSTTLSRGKNKKSQSNEVLALKNERDRISRSISVPKDKEKKAGWFNLSNKNKKQEINTRVR